MKLGLRKALEVGAFIGWATWTAAWAFAGALLENARDALDEWRAERVKGAR